MAAPRPPGATMNRIPAFAFLAITSACTFGPGDQPGQGQQDSGAAFSPEQDLDGDGFPAMSEDGTQVIDCDDLDASIRPDQDEVCDGIDNNCDGAVDEHPLDGVASYADADGDGFGDADSEAFSCTVPAHRVPEAGDCDDRDAKVSPDAAEVCDGVDTDCNGYMLSEEINDDIDDDGTPDCIDPDIDGDGVSNEEEEAGRGEQGPTDPTVADSDGDGIADGQDNLPNDPRCNKEVYFESDLGRPNDDEGWERVSGDWHYHEADFSAGELATHGYTTGATLWLAGRDWTDVVVEVDLYSGGEGSNAGVLVRQQGPGDETNDSQPAYYIGVDATSQTAYLGIMGGFWQQLASAPISMRPGEWATLRVEAKGPRITAFVNDELVMDVTDSTYANGSVGLRSHKEDMAYQNLRICL